MNTISITLPDGSTRVVEIQHMPAMTGWQVQRDFEKFMHTDDKEFRTQFTMAVLSFCVVHHGPLRVPLQTDAIVDNHLGSWQNIKEAFEAILKHNGIDPATHTTQVNYWNEVGAQMAASFLATCQDVMGPLLKMGVPANADNPR